MSEDQPEALTKEQDLQRELERLRREVSRLEHKVEQLDRLAHEDSLVPLPNRRGFMRQLERLIARVARYGDSGALLFIDIDGLKMINDSFGHSAGDEALIKVSELLQAGTRTSDCVARIGGDEFAILLEHADEEVARATATRLTDLVAGSELQSEDNAFPLSIAVGVAVIAPEDDGEAVMARADAEMYRVKDRA